MKEADIWLNPQEIQALLQGSLRWTDVKTQATRSQTRSKMRVKMLEEIIFENQVSEEPPLSQAAVQETAVQETAVQPREEKGYRGLAGRPVIWLLVGVGSMTVFSWCYYVLFV